MDMKKVSINLSYMLRHSTDPLYINLEGGWADVQTIINSIKEKYPEVNIDILEQIVAEDTKGRYLFNETHDKIRANQGHSIPGVVIQMEEPDPPEFLYHGTATRFLDFILNEIAFDGYTEEGQSEFWNEMTNLHKARIVR